MVVVTTAPEVGTLVEDEAAPVDEAAQATLRVSDTPLLAQVDSNVAAAAVQRLAMERRRNESRGLTLLICATAVRSKTT